MSGGVWCTVFLMMIKMIKLNEISSSNNLNNQAMNAISYISNNLITPIQEEENDELNDENNLQSQQVKNENLNWFWIIIFFIPKLIIIKPILFIWFIITFPLTLFEQQNNLQKKPDKIQNQIPQINKFDDDLSGGGEIVLQRDLLKGSLLKKLSTTNKPSIPTLSSIGTGFSSKRMGRFLFPKKLIPKSILFSKQKKKLVLDLDETLIHSISRSTTTSNNSQSTLIEVKFKKTGISTLYYVNKRPYCDFFLSRISQWYDLIIFTASMKEYADPVIDWLETSFKGKFLKRYYRHHCILRDGVGYIKDLSILNDSTNENDSNNLNDIILIDNSPVSFAMNVDNAIQVEGWISDPTDQDLLNLLPFLKALRNTTDVKNLLSLKNGERAFNL